MKGDGIMPHRIKALLKNLKTKLIIFIVTIIFIATIILSVFYEAYEFNHICNDADCPVCECIHQAEAILRTISSGHLAIMMIAVTTNIIFSSTFTKPILAYATPVSFKIRLND